MSTQVDTLERRTDHYDEAVLINVVEFVEFPEHVIRTLVRLDCVDRIYGILPHPSYFSRRFGCVFCGIVRNGEIDMLPWTARCASGSDHEERISQMIKGAPQILKNLPC